MKKSVLRFVSVWLLVASSLLPDAVFAQEVIVGEPRWHQAGDEPDQMPVTKGRLRPAYPKELRETDEIGYVVLQRYVGSKGEGRSLNASGTQAAFQRAVEAEFPDWTMKPAVRNGQPVDAAIWVAVIFNPASSSEKNPDATPRLLVAKPVFVPRSPAPRGAAPIVRMKLNLDEKGEVTQAAPETELKDDLATAIVAAVKEWEFAPARRGGHPVAAELVMPVICEPPLSVSSAKRVPPKLIKRVEPEYPLAMRRFRLEGRVQVEFEVDATGKAQNPVIKQSNNPAFDEPAIEALLASKFEPATADGKPVKSRLRQEIRFQMQRGGTDAFNISGGNQSKIPEEWRVDTTAAIRSVRVPVYPYALRAEGVRGSAKALMVIDPRGRVVGVTGVTADRPEFGHALVAALECFQFDPAIRDGKPVKSLLGIEQHFNSRDLGDEAADWLLGDEKKHPERIVSAAGLDRPVKPVSRRAPVFPVNLGGDVTAGTAHVECLIDKKGRARLPRVVEATDPAFGYAAVQALAEWWFEPPTVAGKPVVVRVRVPFEFQRR